MLDDVEGGVCVICIVLSESDVIRFAWQLQIEDLSAEYRCLTACSAEQAMQLLREPYIDAVLLSPERESAALLDALDRLPPLAPPFLLGLGYCAPDGKLMAAQELPAMLRYFGQMGQMPVYCSRHLPMLTALSRSMLQALGVPPHLRAWDFLPDMAALTVVHPPLLHDLTHHLYPLIARHHGITPGAVERRLRLCVESTWSRGGLSELERFFGHSVDPERGKPTNREFLCRVQERLTLAAVKIIRT